MGVCLYVLFNYFITNVIYLWINQQQSRQTNLLDIFYFLFLFFNFFLR